LMKFGRVVFELCERTDRQTDTHHNTPHPSRGRSRPNDWITTDVVRSTATIW